MAKKQKSKALKLKSSSRFSRQQLLIFVVIFAAVGGLVIWRSLAAPAKPSGQLALTGEMTYNGVNPAAPKDCLHEDSQDYRYYSGSLNGSFTSTYNECNGELTDGFPWYPGGEGLEADITSSGTLTDLTITSPAGEVRHAAIMSSPTTKGKTNNHYAVCLVPPYYLSTDTGTSPIPGGTYTITLSGQLSKTTYTTRADMTDVNFQQRYCPASQQNIIR